MRFFAAFARERAALALSLLLVELAAAAAVGQVIAQAEPKSAGQAPDPDAPGEAEAPVTALADLLERLARVQGMSARYVENKRIALLKRPLRSEGRIRFARPDLLLREVERPERQTMLLRGDSLYLSDASGSRAIELDRHPALRPFVHSFVYVLAGDRAALERLYRVRFAVRSDGGWELELTPRDDSLARFVSRASLRGRGAVVERMTLEEPSGDVSEVSFSEVDLGVVYSAAERARVFRVPGG